MEQENPLAGQKNYIHNSKGELFAKKTLSTSKILKSIVYATCTGMQKIFQKRITQQGIVEEDLL